MTQTQQTQTAGEALQQEMHAMGQAAREAARLLANASSAAKNTALLAAASAIEAARDELLSANAAELDAARSAGADAAFIDRLTLGDKGIASMAAGLRAVAALADPVGEISGLAFQPNGIQVGRMRVPLGVIAIIYEARPNVTADAAALCLKSGNACILRGGSEAVRSNQLIARCLRQGLLAAGLPENAVQVLRNTDRAAVGLLITLPQYVDVVVPRGGKGLIARIAAESRVPVLKHLDGVCHVYIDAHANAEQAIAIADNAKTQRYGTCNTMETLLVHADIAGRVLPALARRYHAKGVELRGCEATRQLLEIEAHLPVLAAKESDWSEEYLAPILAIRIVDSLDAAMAHIRRYGSQHTDAIVTDHHGHAMRFLREVDSSSVMVNASTRFADGYEYGLGAEIGISTDKLHARGPVGLEGLTSQKFVVLGNGHVRD